MSKNSFIKRCELLPVNVIATALGFATLSNMWALALGFPWVRIVTHVGAAIVWIMAAIKMTRCYPSFKAEYTMVVPCALYATFSMLAMLLGAFILDIHATPIITPNPVPALATVGRAVWIFGLALHAVQVSVFTFRFVIKGGVKLDSFLPTWFVTYMGFLVGVVTGLPVGFPWIMQALMVYGIVVYPLVVIGQLVRIRKKPIPHMFKPTGAIFLAPPSLFFIAWLNVAQNPDLWNLNIPAVVWLSYLIVFVTIIRVATLIPGYIRLGFSPGMAALTFSSAIATVATFRMVGWLNANGMGDIAFWLNQFFGVQMFLTTVIMVYVGYNFYFLWRKDPLKLAPADSSAAKLTQNV
ncbi:MAG: hypothetical protein FWD91_08015 [Treponema sp.]|nr:hypothetical protein [Treponema sp.]